MDNPGPHIFTFDEANSILAVIQPLMRDALEIRNKILASRGEIWPVIEKALGNGGNLAAGLAVQDFERLNKLVHQIQSTGAILKDINTGLVDFPALRDGREVYLCWKYGEDRIAYWHPIGSGFTDRQIWD